MGITKKTILLVCILIASIVIALVPMGALAADPSVTRVQGPVTKTSTGSGFTVTMTQPPQVGNVLIVTVGVYVTGSGTPKITPSIASQTGIVWLDAGGISNTASTASSNIEIFVGVITGTPSSTLTIHANTAQGSISAYADTAAVCEYSGLDTGYILSNVYDTQNTAKGNSGNPNTGLTDETQFPYELWVGCTMKLGQTQSAPIGNSFSMLNDGSKTNGVSLGYLEETVSDIGQAQSSTTASGSSGQWVGVIVTLPLLLPIPPAPENPIGVIAPIAAIGLALVAWTAIKRSKSPAQPAVSL